MHWAAITAHLAQFLTVCVHQLLFERRAYPVSSFLDARVYNFAVKQNRHPGVCSWIQSAVAAAMQEIRKGTVARVVLAFAHADTCDILERFVFDVERLPVIPREDAEVPIVQDDAPADEDPHGPGGSLEYELADLTEQFRAVLSTLSMVSQRLSPIISGCTFTLAVELRDKADPPVGHPQPWIPARPGIKFSRSSTTPSLSQKSPSDADTLSAASETQDSSRTVPLRALDAQGIMLEVWAEEGIAKQRFNQT